MRKEALWAILVGVIFGIVIAFGIVRINSSLKPKGEAAKISPTPTPLFQEFKITINKPEEGDVITTESLVVSGITKPKTIVIISGEEDDYLVSSDDKGFFAKEVNLTAGVNRLVFTAFDASGTKSTEKISIIYSSAFEEKGEDRLEKAANKPKAYMGTVTDITDSTIQIRSVSSEIKQISTKENVAVVKTSPQPKEVKLTDIAIGDFIVAMGYKNGNEVLASQRILITPPVTEPKVTVSMLKGSDVTPTKATLVYLFKDDEIKKSKASAIEDESQVISVALDANSKSSLRTIFIVQ